MYDGPWSASTLVLHEPAVLLQVDILAVFPIICQRRELRDARTACSLLSVSKGWRNALQQCPPWVTVSICLSRGNSLGKVTSIAAWMISYGFIVRELIVSERLDAKPYTLVAANQLLASSLQLAASKGRPAGLQRVHLEYSGGCKLLSSLPAATVTSLVLRRLDLKDPSVNYLAPGIEQLTNLRDCSLWFKVSAASTDQQAIPPTCLSTFSALTSLTSLDIVATGYSLNPVPCLPSQLQQLMIYMEGEFLLDASPLTSLSSLHLIAAEEIAAGTRLPASLCSLRLSRTPLQPGAVSILSNVRKLSMTAQQELSGVALAELGQLTQLESISLEVLSLKAAAAAAVAWNLPQLQHLDIYLADDLHGDAQLNRAVLQGLAAAKQLTSLGMTLPIGDGLLCGSSIAQLSNLQELRLTGCGGVREDMLALRSLTGLTSLSMEGCSMDDTVAAALLCSFTGLRHLWLSSCPKVTDAVVPVIGAQLWGLQMLTLLDLHGFGDGSVQLLTELTQLKCLSLGGLGLTREGAQQLASLARFCIKGTGCGQPY